MISWIDTMSYKEKVKTMSNTYGALLEERKKNEALGIRDEWVAHTRICNVQPILYVANDPEIIAEEYEKLSAENERIRWCIEQVLADSRWSRLWRAYKISKETLGTATSALENMMRWREFVKKSLPDGVEETELTKAYQRAYSNYNSLYLALQELVGKTAKWFFGKKYYFSPDTKKNILEKVS